MPADFQDKTTGIIACCRHEQLTRLWTVLLAAKLVTCGAAGGESMLAPAVRAIEAGDFGGEAVTRADRKSVV